MGRLMSFVCQWFSVDLYSTDLFLLLCLQGPNISLMLVRVIGVSHPLCLWVSSMIQIEVTLWMILLLWRPRFLAAEWLTIGRMTRERIQVMWVWKIKELPVIWTLSYKHCTTYRTSGRCDTMHLHLDIHVFTLRHSSYCTSLIVFPLRLCIICQPLKMTCHQEVFP